MTGTKTKHSARTHTPLDFKPQVELVTIEELAALLKVTPRTIQSWLSKGAFPQPIKFTQRCYRWRLEDIYYWQQGIIAAMEDEDE